MKLDAFENRTTARDLFDLGYILYEKYNELTPKTKERFLKTFKDVDFIDLLLSREAAFKEDSILTESDLFESITRLKKGIESVS
jgi:predicted nucleotidyltransferase component of viral defense system